MNRIRHAAAAGLLGIALIFILAACGGPEPTATPVAPTATVPSTATAQRSAPTPPPATATPVSQVQATPTTATPVAGGPSGGPQPGISITGPEGALLTKAVTAMKSVTSYHFTLQNTVQRAAGPTTVAGEGDYQAPDKRRVSMQISKAGPTELISIGNDVYFGMGGSQKFMLLSGPSNPLGSVGAAGTAQDPSMIAQSIESAQIVGDETVDGVNTTHLKFTYDIDKAMASATQSTPGTVLGKATGDMWIEKDTSYVRQIRIDTSNQGTPSTASSGVVQATYSKFNEPVNPPIEAPKDVTNMPGSAPSGDAGTPGP